MNNGKAERFADGGPVGFSIGDINVTESSNPQATASAIVSEIRTGMRRGRFKLA